MTMPTLIQLRGNEVDFLRETILRASQGLGSISDAFHVVIDQQSWQERQDPRDGKVYACASFVDLVTAKFPRGFGLNLEDVRELCRKDDILLNEFDAAIQNPNGTNQYSEGVDIVNTLNRPDGNSAQHALRKLRKDRPDLHAMVLANELSPNAAMIDAGFRHKTATVPIDDPAKVAAFLAKHFAPNEIRTIAAEAIALAEGRD